MAPSPFLPQCDLCLLLRCHKCRVHPPQTAQRPRSTAMLACAGIMEEMMNDALEAGEEDLSDEAEAEVDKVVMEITGKALADLAPTPSQQVSRPAAAEEQADPDADIQRRLAELRSAA